MIRDPIGRSSRRKSSPEKRTRGGEPFSVTTRWDSSSYSFLRVFKERIGGGLPQVENRPLISTGERPQPDVRIYRGGPPHHRQHRIVGSAVGVGVALVERQALPDAVVADRIGLVRSLADRRNHLPGGDPADILHLVGDQVI